MSTVYHKINSIFKRDDRGRLVVGEWSDDTLDYLKDNEWEFTEKVDGTNIRLHFDDTDASFRGNEHAFISGRTDNAQIPPKLLNRLVELMKSMPLESVFSAAAVTLYGEGYGAGIQKGGGNYKSDGCDFVLFDVMVGGWWLGRDDVDDVAKRLGIDSVPVLGHGTLYDACDYVKANPESLRWPGVRMEGIVARPTVQLFDRRESRIITKIKARDFNE